MAELNTKVTEKLATTISAWKAEVGSSQERLAKGLAATNNQLARLLELFQTRGNDAVELVALKEENERLKRMVEEHDLPAGTVTRYSAHIAPEVGALKSQINTMATQLGHIIAKRTEEISQSHEHLSNTINTAANQLSTIALLVNPEAPAIVPQEELAPLRATIQDLQNENQTLRLRLTALEEAAEQAAEPANPELEANITCLQEENDGLKIQIATLEAQCDAAREEAAIAKTDAEKERAQAEEVRKKSDALEAKLMEAAIVEQEKEALADTLADKEGLIDTLQQDLARLKEQQAEVDEQLQQQEVLVAELEHQRQQADENVQAMEDLSEKITGLGETLQDREAAIEIAHAEKELFQQQIDELTEEITSLKAQCQELTEQRDGQTRVAGRLKSQQQELSQQLEEQLQKNEDLTRRCTELSGQCEALKSENEAADQSSQKLNDLQQEYHQLQASYEALQEEFSDFQTQDRQKVEVDTDVLVLQRDSLQEMLMDLEQQLEAARSREEEGIQTARELLSELETLQHQDEQHAVELASRQDIIQQQEAEILQLRQQVEQQTPAESTEPEHRFVGSVGAGLDLESAKLEKMARDHSQQVRISEYTQPEGHRLLGEILVCAGIIPEEDLQQALKTQRSMPERLIGQLLVENFHVNEEAVAQAVACQLSLPFITPSRELVHASVRDLLPRDLCVWHICVPLWKTESALVIAMANPQDMTALAKLNDITQLSILPVLATSKAILNTVDELYGTL